MNDLMWACVPNPPAEPEPEWVRTAAIDGSGVVYGSAAIAGPENLVVLAAVMDGASVVARRGHAFIDVRWMAGKYPDRAAVCDAIRRKMRWLFRPYQPPGHGRP